MMNKSKIEWTDFTWNPVTGCLHGCEYCYARKQARRFCGDIRLNKGSEQLQKDENGLYILEKPFKNQTSGKVIPDPVGFEPIMHKYRLDMPAKKKKPANIFVGSMADLFGEWVPDEWIREVLAACAAAPWHNYLFLTKNPYRYAELAEKGLLPEGDNFWWGTTITNQEDYENKVIAMFRLPTNRRVFFSIEPMHGRIDMALMPDWIIIGAETGQRKNKTIPQREWIKDIVNRCVDERIFMKDSLTNVWEDPLIQQFPEPLQMKEVIIPHCKECEHIRATPQGKRGTRYDCEIGWESEGYDDRGARHIPGRYSRTSPPWCPKREEAGKP